MPGMVCSNLTGQCLLRYRDYRLSISEGSMLGVVRQASESTVAAQDLRFFLSYVCIFLFNYLFSQHHCKLLAVLHCHDRQRMQILNMCLQFGRQSDAICTQVAATHMQIFLILHARGGYLGSLCMQLAAQRRIALACIATSQMQNLHALVAITLLSRQIFATTQGN